MFSNSSSMLGLIQTVLQSHLTMSFVPTTLWHNNSLTGKVTSWCSLSWARTRIQHQNSSAYHLPLQTSYQQQCSPLPEFLLGRPRQVQATCISNMDKAKEIKNDSIISMETDGCYEIKFNSGGTYSWYLQRCLHVQKFYFATDTLQTYVCSFLTTTLELDWSLQTSYQQCQSDTGSTTI